MEDTFDFSKIKSLTNETVLGCQYPAPGESLRIKKQLAELRDRKIQNQHECEPMDPVVAEVHPSNPPDTINPLIIPPSTFFSVRRNFANYKLKGSSRTKQINCLHTFFWKNLVWSVLIKVGLSPGLANFSFLLNWWLHSSTSVKRMKLFWL